MLAVLNLGLRLEQVVGVPQEGCSGVEILEFFKSFEEMF